MGTFDICERSHMLLHMGYHFSAMSKHMVTFGFQCTGMVSSMNGTQMSDGNTVPLMKQSN